MLKFRTTRNPGTQRGKLDPGWKSCPEIGNGVNIVQNIGLRIYTRLKVIIIKHFPTKKEFLLRGIQLRGWVLCRKLTGKVMKGQIVSVKEFRLREVRYALKIETNFKIPVPNYILDHSNCTPKLLNLLASSSHPSLHQFLLILHIHYEKTTSHYSVFVEVSKKNILYIL